MSVTTLIKTELDRDNKTIDKILFYLEQHKTILNKTAILFLHKKNPTPTQVCLYKRNYFTTI